MSGSLRPPPARTVVRSRPRRRRLRRLPPSPSSSSSLLLVLLVLVAGPGCCWACCACCWACWFCCLPWPCCFWPCFCSFCRSCLRPAGPACRSLLVLLCPAAGRTARPAGRTAALCLRPARRCCSSCRVRPASAPAPRAPASTPAARPARPGAACGCACARSSAERARRPPARHAVPPEPPPRGCLGPGCLGLRATPPRRTGGLDRVDELRLLHRAGAGDAQADGHGLEVGEQHRVEATDLAAAFLAGFFGRGRSRRSRRGGLGHVGPSHVASPAPGREGPRRRMVVARARGQMDRVGRVRRTARRQVSSRALRRTRSPGRGAPSRRGSASGRTGRCRPAPKASTVGPAPDTTAGTPSARSRRTSSSVAGIAGSRWSWCRQSRVAREQLLGLPGQRGDQQRGAPGVGRGLRVRDGLGQQPARDLGVDAGPAARGRPR